jgi:signal transduction histidine kinase
MVAAIGHESRNALQRIQASVELLKLQLVDHAQALRDLETIERADAELRSLFSDLRSWITPIKLDQYRIDLQDVWNHAWEHLLSVRGACDARLDAFIGDVDTSIEADASLLEQVFRNLFENSLQAASGPVRVVIEAIDSKIGRMPALRLRIRDNGKGIAEQDMDRCFEPFYTTKRRGIGLGLAIVKQLVEAHHGAIELRSSAPASGVEVELTLPRGLPERLNDERSTGKPKAMRRVAAKALPR